MDTMKSQKRTESDRRGMERRVNNISINFGERRKNNRRLETDRRNKS